MGSYAVQSTSVSNESITFGEGVKDITYYGEGTSVTGLGDEAVAALTTGYTEISKSGLTGQTDVAKAAISGQQGIAKDSYSAIEKIVGSLQAGTEQALSGIDKAYAKSVSGTAALESLKPYIVGALALGAVAILSGAMRK